MSAPLADCQRVLRRVTRHLAAHHDLSRPDAADTVRLILEERCDFDDAAALLLALASKGATPDEIAGAVDAILSYVGRVRSVEGAVDIVGTGGDGLATLNISTVAALVVAAAGAKVVKAGNRAATGLSGSADVLEAMGIAVDTGPDRIPALVRQEGFAFVHTAAIHPALHRLAPLRRRLGVRTIFNLTGPLTNPFVTHARVIGTSSRQDQEALAESASLLGYRKVWVVHSLDGMDEVSTSAKTEVISVDGGSTRSFAVDPSDLPVVHAGPDALRGGAPQRNAALATAVLRGDAPTAIADCCLLNAAALLQVSGHAADLGSGLAASREAVADGRAQWLLERLRTNSVTTTRSTSCI